MFITLLASLSRSALVTTVNRRASLQDTVIRPRRRRPTRIRWRCRRHLLIISPPDRRRWRRARRRRLGPHIIRRRPSCASRWHPWKSATCCCTTAWTFTGPRSSRWKQLRRWRWKRNRWRPTGSDCANRKTSLKDKIEILKGGTSAQHVVHDSAATLRIGPQNKKKT